MINNQVGNGFRCRECDRVVSKMWGEVCNKCRAEERRHQELIKSEKKYTQKELDQEIQTAVQKEREMVLEFIKNHTIGPNVNGSYKYWKQESFEEYFEDHGYKFGPQRFIDDLLEHLTTKDTKDVV